MSDTLFSSVLKPLIFNRECVTAPQKKWAEWKYTQYSHFSLPELIIDFILVQTFLGVLRIICKSSSARSFSLFHFCKIGHSTTWAYMTAESGTTIASSSNRNLCAWENVDRAPRIKYNHFYFMLCFIKFYLNDYSGE